jgi:hypothetical protein
MEGKFKRLARQSNLQGPATSLRLFLKGLYHLNIQSVEGGLKLLIKSVG